MTRHYSTKDFFRQMPNALLARYFATRGVFDDLDFAGMKETVPDELMGAWHYLPDTKRGAMEADFREVFELSTEKGFQAIVDEAEWHLRDQQEEREAFVQKLSALANHFERAMVTFLDHHAYWKGANRFFHADSLPYWRKRKNLPHVAAAVDETSLRELAGQIRTYFHKTEGRGNNCIVEPFRRGELDYYFAYPEDYSQQAVEWVDGKFGRRPHNPAFEIIFVFSSKEGSLDLNYRGSKKAVEPLQTMFANAILKLDELPPDPKDSRVYDLWPMRSKNFGFQYGADSGIKDVAVKKIRLSSRVKKGDRITLEADVVGDKGGVHALMDQISQAVPLDQYSVTQVEVVATIEGVDDKPSKQFTFRITHPNSCSLKYDDVGLKLREMLEASGIEPKEVDDGEPTSAENQ